MTPEEIYNLYKPRIETLMSKIAETCKAGIPDQAVSEVDEWTDEEYTWNLNIGNDLENSVDITFTILESEVRDGEENGVSFDIDIVGYEGRILGGFCPYNYTSQLWVSRDNPSAIEGRFRVFERLNQDSIIPFVLKGLKG